MNEFSIDDSNKENCVHSVSSSPDHSSSPVFDPEQALLNRIYDLREEYVRELQIKRRRGGEPKRSLGKVRVHSSAFHCPWVAEPVTGVIRPDTTIVSHRGDVYTT